ncbi:hypothetical protein QOZ80_3BG0254880 [Eleusine coracana subsp. coracana]|nr:hypothetical protein QOZ80_3BG0254880 [Eleusine coracana subsp. coracana]
MDRNWYNVEVKVEGFLSVEQMVGDPIRWFTQNWVVDSESFSLEFLTTSLKAEMSWDTNQKVVFWVFNNRCGEDMLLDSDAQFADVLDMYIEEKQFSLLASVFDKDMCEAICVLPPELPKTTNAPPLPPIAEEASTSSVPKATDCGETAGLETDADEPDLPNVFDVVEEYVGVNDEYMYGFSDIEPQ